MTVSEFIKEHKSEYPDDGREFVAIVAGRTKNGRLTWKRKAARFASSETVQKVEPKESEIILHCF